MHAFKAAVLRFLMRQGLAVRGHTNEEGNLYQLLKCRAQEDPELQSWLKEGKYQSPEIVNEQFVIFTQTATGAVGQNSSSQLLFNYS